MRLFGSLIAIAVVVAVTLVYLDSRRAESPARVDEHMASTSRQIDDLHRELVVVKAQLAAQQNPPRAAAENRVEDPQAVRATEAEQHRAYIADVAQAFDEEKIDSAWATRVSTRVGQALYNDEALRNVAHQIECRAQTCRLTIDDDGSGRLSKRMSSLALSLVDVLPNIAAERVDQGNGRSAMVLYLSSQREQTPAPPK